jgi:hypothetical protein
VWGGVPGSATFKGSPRKYRLKDNLVKLPPLTGAKTAFGSETAGKLSISESLMPKLGVLKQTSSTTKNGRNTFTMPSDSTKPNTASGHHSMKRLESVEEVTSKPQVRRSVGGRNQVSAVTMGSQFSV